MDANPSLELAEKDLPPFRWEKMGGLTGQMEVSGIIYREACWFGGKVEEFIREHEYSICLEYSAYLG